MVALEDRCGREIVQIAAKILDWSQQYMPDFVWGKGGRDGSCFPGFSHNGTRYFPFSIWTYGRLEMQFKWWGTPFDATEMKANVATRLNKIAGVSIAPEAYTRRPAFDLRLLSDPEAMGKFLSIMEWFLDRVRLCSNDVPIEAKGRSLP